MKPTRKSRAGNKTRRAGIALGFLLATTTPAQQYVISTYAGGAPPLPAPARGVDVAIAHPRRLATDGAGNVFISSPGCVFKLDRNGVVSRIAGTCRSGYSGDGGPATSAQLGDGTGVAVDRAGNLFVADSGNHRIRKISTSGIIVTVAGDGSSGYSGDGGPATNAQLNNPSGVAVDGAGTLFIADRGNRRVRRVLPNGLITPVAGGGTVAGSFADGGPATSAVLELTDVAVDSAGNLFIAGEAVRKVSPSGIITTVASSFSWNGLAMDGAGNLFFANNFSIRKVSPNGIITTVAGNGTRGFSGDGGPATSAQLSDLAGVAVDGTGNLFISDSSNHRIRRVSPDEIIATVAGNGNNHGGYSGDGGPATGAQLAGPWSVAVDGARNLFIADKDNHRVRKVSTDGIITTVAGNGTGGFSGDGGPAARAQLRDPIGVAVDRAGNLFVADHGNLRVRKVSSSGSITTVAGDGTQGRSSDGGPATSAQLRWPMGVAVDAAGNLYIADHDRIRKVSPEGIITTAAGTGTDGFSGDGGPATSAQLNWSRDVAVDSAGNLFTAEVYNSRIRKISTSGVITTVAGKGSFGFSGDGGPATDAELSWPYGVTVDGEGNLFIANSEQDCGGNERIREVSPSGIITTVAGIGSKGFSGDGGPATRAELMFPSSAAVDSEGNVYVADTGNDVIRILRPTNRSVFTVAVVDAASQGPDAVSPGKIVVIYGTGLGPTQLIQNQPRNGAFGTELAGTTVSFNGLPAPVLYVSDMQVAAIVPYAVTGSTAQVTVTYQGGVSAAFTVPVAASAPSLFTSNQTGAGQAAAINAVDGKANTAANPVRIGGFISLYATGEGQTTPAGVDGRIGISTGTGPVLPVSITVGGIPATVQYRGSAAGQVAGLMQVNVQIPSGVQPGGYVPVVLQVGNASTTAGAVWIAVSGN